jgi:cytidyltransferase-like protein
MTKKELKEIGRLIKKLETKVYIPMSADLFHIGHLRAIKQCAEKGSVYVGLLTDRLMREYKGEPIIPFKQRKEILEGISEVHKVIEQDSLTPNLEGMTYLASGDGFEKDELKALGKCKLLKLKYCKEQSTTKIKEKIANGRIKIVV